jgi:hypothetical protein
MVHESEGPVGGSVVQNWVSRSRPPGELKQQEFSTAVVFWQLTGMSGGQEGREQEAVASEARPRARIDRIAGIVYVCTKGERRTLNRRWGPGGSYSRPRLLRPGEALVTTSE